ncbi:MAG: hypothetical protein PHC30_02650, partial [Lentisphaeria bacterium]|nr:hypothetical protein [Lentisphaeria bacterium]
ARPPDPADSARRHLQYALNYLQARRFDRAAIEFIFAEGSYETDDAVLEQAGDAFAQADADHFQEFFRRDLPSSLAKVSDRAQRYRRADTARQLRQRAVELYRQAIANGANQDDLELKIALCLAFHDRGSAQAILRERFQRTGDFHHGLDLLRLYRHYGGLPGEVIDKLCQRYPDQPLAHYLQAMDGLRKKLVSGLSARDGLWQLRWRRDLPPEEREKLAAALAVGITTLEQVAARPSVDYPPTRPLPPRRQLPGVPYVDLPTETTDDGLPVPSAIRGLAAHELLEITTRQYQALLEAPNPQPAQDAEKRLLLTRMLTHLHLLPDTDSGLFHTVCRQHRDHYRDPERLLNELLQVQALLPMPPSPAKIASGTTPTPLAAACADKITGLRRELSYLTRWNIQLVAGQPSALGIGPFATKDCGNGYVDLDFFLGCVDRCAVEATAVVVSDQPREAMLRLGFDHELTVELNGRIIFGPVRDHIARRDEHLVPVTLQAGPNHFKMLVKDDKLSFGFYARLTTPDGEPLFFPARP